MSIEGDEEEKQKILTFQHLQHVQHFTYKVTLRTKAPARNSHFVLIVATRVDQNGTACCHKALV